MPHETALLATFAAGFGLAFAFGFIAVRMKLPPILGYLVAGMVVGPFTPGYVADAGIASQLAELGVILLMFGVGMHFSVEDLLAVRRIAVPGAIAQIGAATVMGAACAMYWGWSLGTALVFGLCLSVASTVVLLRALEDRNALDSTDGQIAVGWLIVEDLVTVLALVLLPAVAPMIRGEAALDLPTLATTLGITLAKVVGFVALMLIVGRRVVPLILGKVVGTGSRELFTLAVLAIAVGIAVGVAGLFDVSFALGAFFAGIVVSESDFSHDAAQNALPMQDAFAVLFFVSVGMLFDPSVLLEQPGRVALAVLIVVFGKSIAALVLVLSYRYPPRTALTIAASLAQIGEFSFILVALGISLKLVPVEAQSVVVASALISIAIHPLVFKTIDPLERWYRKWRGMDAEEATTSDELSVLPPEVDASKLVDHVVLVGYGRVGAPIATELGRHGIPYVVVEQSRERAELLRTRGVPAIFGDGSRAEILRSARLEVARVVVVAALDAYQARAIAALGKKLNPAAEIIVRTHSDEEREFLEGHGATLAMVGERELAVSMMRQTFRRFDVKYDMASVAQRVLYPTELDSVSHAGA